MGKYSYINNIPELEAAQRQIKAKLKEKTSEMTERFYDLRESFTPSNLLVSGIRSISGFIPFDTILLFLIRRLRNRMNR